MTSSRPASVIPAVLAQEEPSWCWSKPGSSFPPERSVQPRAGQSAEPFRRGKKEKIPKERKKGKCLRGGKEK